MKASRLKPKLVLVAAVLLAGGGVACGGAATATVLSPTPSPASTPVPTATPAPLQEPADNGLLEAEFTFNPRSIPRLDSFQTEVTFTAITSGVDDDSLAYEWKFSGGRPETATGPVVTATFSGLSPHQVVLTVSDGRGRTVSVIDVVALGFGQHYGPF
ncbi:MAG: PKD domain-containing protein [Dehalococcoidia bacterium]